MHKTNIVRVLGLTAVLLFLGGMTPILDGILPGGSHLVYAAHGGGGGHGGGGRGGGGGEHGGGGGRDWGGGGREGGGMGWHHADEYAEHSHFPHGRRWWSPGDTGSDDPQRYVTRVCDENGENCRDVWESNY